VIRRVSSIINMNHPQPLLGKVGIIGLVPDLWDPHWQVRHHVLSRLAGYFSVVWMNYPRAWRDLSSLYVRNSKDGPALPDGLQIYDPGFWLPRFGRPPWLAHFTLRQRLNRARNLLRARGCTRLVLYIWRPEFAGALEEMEHDLSIYHVDDEYSFSPTEVEIPPAERRILESAGQVFIHSPELMRRKGGFNPNTELVPNGVDYRLYATSTPEPEDLRSIPHPRIGYVGYLKRMLDFPLLLELSTRHPQWSFVFVGPKRPHAGVDDAIQQMSQLPNVHFLGGKRTELLGAYPQHFDACIMPYRVDDYTNCIYPLKLHEYLASGKPVVSAPIRSVIEFGNVITIASNYQEWSDAIERALSPEEQDKQGRRRAERQRVAQQHDWDGLVDKIARTIARRLDLHIPDVSRDADYVLQSAVRR
jgi:glycosyltransferase involved in cell wall biosynthesis